MLPSGWPSWLDFDRLHNKGEEKNVPTTPKRFLKNSFEALASASRL
jgi:hypothetical protein